MTYDDSASEAGGGIEVAARRGVPRNLVVLVVVNTLDDIDLARLYNVSTYKCRSRQRLTAGHVPVFPRVQNAGQTAKRHSEAGK